MPITDIQTEPLSTRLEKNVHDAIDEFVRQVEGQTGVRVTKSEAVRALLLAGLEAKGVKVSAPKKR